MVSWKFTHIMYRIYVLKIIIITLMLISYINKLINKYINNFLY